MRTIIFRIRMPAGNHFKMTLTILPVLAILLASGCVTGPSGGPTGPGVVITKFEPDFSYMESGQRLILDLEVQNQGGEEATDVVAVLTGIDPDEWDLSSSKAEVDLHDLSPGNPEYNTLGETDTAQWELTAPELPQTIEQVYNPRVRVYYHYITTATKPITLVNENELRRLSQSGQSLPTQTGQQSAGPLSIDIITGNQIRVPENRDPSFPITVVLENTGSGIIAPKDSEPNEDYVVRLTIKLPDGLDLESDCSGFGSGEDIVLSGGRQRSITCEVDFRHLPDIAEQRTITVLAEYDYYIDRTTSVTVKGVETEI